MAQRENMNTSLPALDVLCDKFAERQKTPMKTCCELQADAQYCHFIILSGDKQGWNHHLIIPSFWIMFFVDLLISLGYEMSFNGSQH